MKVALVEPPGQRGYVPIAVAYLAAIVQADPELSTHVQHRLHLGHMSESVDDVVSAIFVDGAPDVLGLSCQGWSLAHADAIAARVAEKNPDVLVIYGGNHVSNGGIALLRERPFVDVVADGEGEFLFRELLRSWRRTGRVDDLAGIPGATVRKEDGTVVQGAERPRATDLSQIPSPYLNGSLDALLRQDCTALLETNRGCPYSCSFCYWGEAIGARVQHFPTERVKAEMRYLAERQVDSWYICDANFGMFDRDRELVDYMVELRAEFGFPRTMHTNWAKNANERVVSLCAKLNNAGIHSTYTLALQSATPEALRLAHRKNMKINRIEELAAICRRHGVVPRGELIWGLPGESYAEFLESFEVLAPHTDALSVYPHYLLPNTEFSRRKQEYGLVTEKAEVDTDYAYCVEHPLMSRSEFLDGMRFIISNNILRVASGFYRVYPRVMKELGVSLASTTEALGGWIRHSPDATAKRFARFYRIPMATHRLSLGEVWAAIRDDRDGFVDMLRQYTEETFHVSLPADQAAVARVAFEFDALTFPVLLSGSGFHEELVDVEYDVVSVRLGKTLVPERSPRTYRVRWPRGLRDYPDGKWYFGLLSYAAEVVDVTADRSVARDAR
ncbi:B12-binding domain-containing radical SAM protein [Actinoplanes couchii]|uniref:Radical SAM domain protein n=1 Tax=Actinoplanes couchii TaxID=403638 RepID=A0ABQ3XSR0_9ACTN|nr:radical SAM protein [Actinoplanes couchii]MDR6315933.1 radical SAM superfamily enzyme YgiQ (UPF0313 family) [Actinoplanes couchii]GID61417.1 hypothetical protein Aco03nite_098210 [Actinoplanes couchii]